VTPYTVLFNTSVTSLVPAGYNWTFGDGFGSQDGPNATHVYYGNSTTYDVSLRASYNGYNDTIYTQTAYITALPKIANWNQPFGTLPAEHTFQPITLQSTTNFTDAAGPSSYTWTFNNGTVPWTQFGIEDAGATTYWNFTQPGTYDLSLNVTNEFGSNTTSIGSYITIVDIPTPTSLITSNMQYIKNYQGTAFKFNDTGEDQHVLAWLWDWGDGLQYNTTSALFKNITHVYNATGKYTVSLTKINVLGAYTNSTPADYININIPTMIVGNSPSYTNRNMTGLFTLAAQNISRADDLSWFTMYNFTQINITAVTLNASAPADAILNAGWSSPGTLKVNVTSPDMSFPTETDFVDVTYLVKDMTNYTAAYGMPFTAINLNRGGGGTQAAIGNVTLYGATNGNTVPTFVDGYLLFTDSIFTKLIKFYNNVNNQKITGQTLTVQWIATTAAGDSGSGTTNNGEFTISSKYDPGISVTGSATGYYNGTVTYVWGNSSTESQFLTPLSGASGSTVWYTPKQVRFKVMDGYNNPLPYTTLTASFVASTLPSSDPSWLQTAYGISRSVAEDMMNGGLAMTGTTGQDGYITFTMHGSLEYNMSVTNTTSGINGWYKRIYPMDNEYLLRVSSTQASQQISTNSYVYTQNTTLWAQELTGNTIRLGLNFTDTSGRSTNVKFYVWDAINGTVYKTNTTAAPGIAMWQTYFDLPNIRGNRYLWNYTAVRS
jgi:PKD repeat protein